MILEQAVEPGRDWKRLRTLTASKKTKYESVMRHKYVQSIVSFAGRNAALLWAQALRDLVHLRLFQRY